MGFNVNPSFFVADVNFSIQSIFNSITLSLHVGFGRWRVTELTGEKMYVYPETHVKSAVFLVKM